MRKGRGKEFQSVDAAKEKERLPLAERIFGTLRRCSLADLRLGVGL